MPSTISDGALAWQRLAVVNKHERDDRILFDEETHSYTIDGTKKGWISTTQFIHGFFGKFDADEVIEKMMKGRNWNSSNKYWGMTPDQIKKMWDESRDEASSAGTRMHLDIEHYYNAEPVGNLAGDGYDPLEGTEWKYFTNYEEKYRKVKGFEAFRTEWLVFNEEIKLAGSIDMVYKKPDGTLAIYDWKRSKEIKFENKYQSGLEPISHLPDTNYWHYSLQLNVYATVLEKFYGVSVTELALVVIHPNNKNYKVVMLNRLKDEVDSMFDYRMAQIVSGTAPTSGSH
jgi:ATP-dependent exoDNAse (exonuclease V) beta subunit